MVGTCVWFEYLVFGYTETVDMMGLDVVDLYSGCGYRTRTGIGWVYESVKRLQVPGTVGTLISKTSSYTVMSLPPAEVLS